MMNSTAAVVVISCVAGSKVFPSARVYSVSEAVLCFLVHSLTAELCAGDSYQCLEPGVVDTQVVECEYRLAREAIEGLKAIVPMGRAGEADEIAKAVLFLISDEAAYVSGVGLAVDGGPGIGSSHACVLRLSLGRGDACADAERYLLSRSALSGECRQRVLRMFSRV